MHLSVREGAKTTGVNLLEMLDLRQNQMRNQIEIKRS